jgi:hypothetical protein
VFSLSTSSDTRIRPVLIKRSKRQAANAACTKIREQLSKGRVTKMCQPPASEFIRDTQKVKSMSSLATVEEVERSRKGRQLEQEQLVLPPDEQHENTG